MKDSKKSYEITIKDNKDPLTQLQNTRNGIKHPLTNVLTSMKGFKFRETLKITFEKLSDGDTIYKTAYFNSRTFTIIKNDDINEDRIAII